MMPETDWVLDQFGTVVDSVAADYSLDEEYSGGGPVQVRRVDREASQIYDGSEAVDMSTPAPERKTELERGVYVGAKLDARGREIRNPGHDLNVEPVIGVQIEGLTHRKHGHVDPDGEDGVPFGELVRRCKTALENERFHPSVDSPDGTYYTVQLTNESPLLAQHADYFGYTFDVLLIGEKDL